MTDFQVDIEIQATPEVVWSVVRDVEHWPEWTPTVTSVQLLDGTPFGLGSRAFIRQPKLRPAKWCVTEMDEPARRFTWVSTNPGVRISGGHSVTTADLGSRVTLSLRFEGILSGFFAQIMRDLSNRYLALEASGLKQRCETKGVASQQR